MSRARTRRVGSITPRQLAATAQRSVLEGVISNHCHLSDRVRRFFFDQRAASVSHQASCSASFLGSD